MLQKRKMSRFVVGDPFDLWAHVLKQINTDVSRRCVKLCAMFDDKKTFSYLIFFFFSTVDYFDYKRKTRILKNKNKKVNST